MATTPKKLTAEEMWAQLKSKLCYTDGFPSVAPNESAVYLRPDYFNEDNGTTKLGWKDKDDKTGKGLVFDFIWHNPRLSYSDRTEGNLSERYVLLPDGSVSGIYVSTKKKLQDQWRKEIGTIIGEKWNSLDEFIAEKLEETNKIVKQTVVPIEKDRLSDSAKKVINAAMKTDKFKSSINYSYLNSTYYVNADKYMELEKIMNPAPVLAPAPIKKLGKSQSPSTIPQNQQLAQATQRLQAQQDQIPEKENKLGESGGVVAPILPQAQAEVETSESLKERTKEEPKEKAPTEKPTEKPKEVSPVKPSSSKNR